MKKAEKFLPLITLAAIFALWWAAADKIDSTIILPSPAKVFAELYNLAFSREFILSLANTALRAIYSFAAAFLPAIAAAWLAFRFRAAEKLLYPVIVIMRAVPTMSVIILCLIWLTDTQSPMAIAFLVLFPLMYSAFLSAFRTTDGELTEVAKVYGVPLASKLYRLYLPSVAISAFPSLVSLISFNVKLTVAGEALAQTGLSLGGAMQSAKFNLETASVLAYTVAAIILSYIAELFIRLIGKLVGRIYEWTI